MLLWHLNLEVPPVVVPGTTTLLIRGFQSGLLVTRGLGVHLTVVASSKVPEPLYSRASPIGPVPASSAWAGLGPDRRFARAIKIGPDPARSRWSRAL
jgi:hypothetical protein